MTDASDRRWLANSSPASKSRPRLNGSKAEGRIDGHSGYSDLVMDVWPCREACVRAGTAAEADGGRTTDTVSNAQHGRHGAEVAVERRHGRSPHVINDHRKAVPASEPDEGDASSGRRDDRCPERDRQVDASVHPVPTSHRVHSHSEVRRDTTADGIADRDSSRNDVETLQQREHTGTSDAIAGRAPRPRRASARSFRALGPLSG